MINRETFKAQIDCSPHSVGLVYFLGITEDYVRVNIKVITVTCTKTSTFEELNEDWEFSGEYSAGIPKFKAKGK